MKNKLTKPTRLKHPVYSEMRVFKCLIRITEVREGIEFMEAPSERFALDPAWVMMADKITYLEQLKDVSKSAAVVSAQLVTHLGQVPNHYHEGLPWHHPKQTPKEERTLEERLPSALENQNEHLDDEIQCLKKEKAGIDKEIAKIRALMSPRIVKK